jgi:threonine aldolase
MKKQFASDNYSGICPESLKYLNTCNEGYALAYGEDNWTEKAADMLRDFFEINCEVFFVFNGTAANSLAISSLCKSYHSVICHELAHIETDECGAPEFYSNGSKILLSKGEHGKINPQKAEYLISKRIDIHYPKPKAISITQATELGTVYTPEEIDSISKIAQKYELAMHMDGARFFNALVSLGCEPRQISWEAGIDVLCLGGTKNGLAVGETVIFFNKDLAYEFEYRCKQAGQLASKMRYIAAPWIGLLENNTWKNNAQHANECAAYLEQQLKKINGVEVMFPRQVNSVFVKLPDEISNKLMQSGWHFYTFIGVGGARFMCSWNTRKKDIDELVGEIKSLIKTENQNPKYI